MKRSNYLLLAAVAVCVSACSKSDVEAVAEQAPRVATVNYPLAWFAEQIAGDAVAVVFPEMEGDPAFWKPSAEDVSGYQDADLILLNGAAYAKWVPTVSLSQSKLVDTSAAYQDQLIALAGEGAHQHGPGDVHTHGAVAFTTWLDLSLAAQQAAAVRDALSKRWPDQGEAFTTNYQSLEAQLLKLDREFESAFKLLGDQPVIGSHPVYQYLSKRYSVNLKSVHWEPDVAPSDVMWLELEDLLETHPAKLMLWEGEPLPEVVARLEQMGIQSIVFDPCGNRPAAGDFMSVMQSNSQGLEASTKRR